MKILKLNGLKPEDCRMEPTDYSGPEMNVCIVSCEKGFCQSGNGTADHAGFAITNDYDDNFWED